LCSIEAGYGWKRRTAQANSSEKSNTEVIEMKKLFLVLMLLASVFIIIGCGGSGGGGGSAASVPQSLPDYTSADLTGDYHIFGMSTGTEDAGYRFGELNVNASGLTGGNYKDFYDIKHVINGGNISIDGNGLLSGAINTDLGINSMIQYGKLNASKSFFSFTCSATNGGQELFTAIRAGNTYSQSDLTGEWKEFLLLVAGANQGAWYFEDTITIDGNGNMSDPGVQLMLAENGIFLADGMVGGVDYSKEFFIWVGNWPTGEKAFAILLKKGTGSFTPSDLQGKWHFSAASPAGASYGYLELDNAGNVVGGHYFSSTGNTPVSNGSVSLNADGSLSGTLLCPNGLEISVIGQINLSKNMMALVTSDSEDVYSLFVMNK